LAAFDVTPEAAYALRFVTLFSLLLCTWSFGHGLFDADDLMDSGHLPKWWLARSISSLGPSQPASVNSGFCMSQVSHRPDVVLATIWIFKTVAQPFPAAIWQRLHRSL